MDTRLFGTNLVTLNETRVGRRRPSKEEAERAYYQEHAPAEAKAPGLISIIAVVGMLGFAASIGSWL